MAAALPIAGLLAQLAFIGHDAGHGAVYRRPAVNRAVGQLAMTVFTGLAFDEWIARHRAHHRHCQDEHQDPDMAVDLVVSLTAGSRQRKGRLGRWLTRHQGVLIGPLSLLFAHSQRLQSQAAVLASPRRHALDAVGLLLHAGLWFGVPCGLLGVPWALAVAVYLLPLTLLGPCLAAIFWVNHIGMPLVTRAETFSFLEHQMVTSRTIVNPPRWHWVFGGLNFQVEHHLFPMVPSRRLAADGASGLLHLALDTCGSVKTPVIGPAFIRPFREHHVDPQAMARHGFVETNGASALACLPILGVAALLPLHGAGPQALHAGLLALGLCAVLINECHRWAHAAPSATPAWARWAQRHRLILPPAQHQRHHTAPFDSHFCMANGWLNPVLNAVLHRRRRRGRGCA